MKHLYFLTVVLLLAVIMGGSIFAQNRPTPAYPATDGTLSNLGKHQSEVLSLPSALPREIFSVGSSCTDGGNRLVSMQYTDGGWGWPLTAPPTYGNILGPIAMGLAQAYQQTGVAGQRTGLSNAGTFLLAKLSGFSPSDGYLAAQLDKIFGGTTYVSHVKTYFYDKLADSTYDRSGVLYNTATYVNKIRTDRASQGIANLAAWDIGMGLVGAAMAGASTSEWIAGVKAEIDELDGDLYYDVIGLAGAIYGLAFVNEDYDPTAGEHVAANNIDDLAAILATYQIEGGGFAWNSGYVIPDDGNETIQETGYSILALNEVDRTTHLSAIQGAADYMMGVQLGTGGWENYSTSGENNEVTGEALWGICAAYPPPVHNITKDVYYPTIQGAINDANAGDVINVAAGTYNEANLLINKGLTLQGAGKATTFIDATASAATGNVVKIDLTSGNVLLDGFTIKTGSGLNGVGAKSTSSGSTITITNNRIEGYRAGATTADCMGLYAQNSYATLVFRNNEVLAAMSGAGVTNTILIEKHFGSTDISYNTFDRTPGNISSDAYFNMNYGGTNITSLQKVSHNIIDMGGGTVFDNSTRGVAISFASSFTGGTALGGFTNVEISNNTLLNLKPSRRGISTWNNSSNGTGGDITNALISGNTISNATGFTGEFGIRVLGKATGTQIVNNIISGVADAVKIQPYNSHEANTTAVHYNSLIATTYGLNNLTTEIIDAENNYWGSVHGPLDAVGTVEMPGNPATPIADMKNTIPADKLGSAVTEKVDYYKWQGKSNSYASGGGIWAGGYVNPTSNDIFAGFDPAASDGVDGRDTVAPPPPPSDYLYLYFLLAPGQPLENYACDVKKEEASIATAAKHWDLKALTDHTSELVTIEYPLTGLPDGFKPTLYDLATGKYQNLRNNPFYEYTSPATITPSSFLVLIGDSTKPTVTVNTPNGGEFLVVGQPYSITWSSSDGTGVLRHYIYWSSTGAAPYSLIDSVNGNVYSYNWTPTGASNSASVKVVARDSVMNEETDISNYTFWILATNSASYSAIAGWNLVSVPLEQTDMSPVGVFGDDYAVPYYTFQYNASGGYSVPSTLIMGQGYWLGSNSAQVVDAVGTPLSTVDFALTNGFNIIGNPYVVPILKDDLRFTLGVDTKTMVQAAAANWLSNVLYGYSGTGYTVDANLGVWKGYWIPMLLSGITIQYRTGLGVPTPSTVPTLVTDAAEGWGVDIGADLQMNEGIVSDHIASFGVNTKASAGFDPVFDAPRPPRSPFDRYVEVSFVVDGENYPIGSIARDYRNSSEAGWELLVTSSHEGIVTLTWDNSIISQLPSDINVELYDAAAQRVVDMKRTNSYSYDQTGTTRRFLINRDDKAVPVSFELIQNYPNPFNPTTKVQYGLPTDANVKVVIFDYLGRQIAVLTDGFVKAGYHEVSFDASQLASGVYIYRLTAIGTNGTPFFDSKKMILAR